MKKYTPIRRFYAHIGFIICGLVIVSLVWSLVAPDSFIRTIVEIFY